MAYSETKIVIGGLAHVPVLIFMANFVRSKFGYEFEKSKDTPVREEPVKIIEVKETLVNESIEDDIGELLNKLDSIEQKADEVFEKVKKKKRIIRRKK